MTAHAQTHTPEQAREARTLSLAGFTDGQVAQALAGTPIRPRAAEEFAVARVVRDEDEQGGEG